jgi:hypothetical protein
MNMDACYCMWEGTRGAHDDFNRTLLKYINGSNLGHSFLDKKVPPMEFLFQFLIQVIQIIICFMHSFLFNNEYFSPTVFFVHVLFGPFTYPKNNSLAPLMYN